MSNSKPILELQNVSKFYDISRNIKELFFGIKPLVKAVENVSFKIFSGETVGVLGESGCGKTTLGKLILNLLEPSKGNIYFLSEDINNYEGKQIKEFKKNVQLIFQNPYDALNPRFTIKNILLEPLRSLDFPADQHKSLLENVMNLVKLSNVNEYLDKYPHELSGGQLQRVVLARALIINPLFVVADEPVSMLDVSVRAGILNAFNEAKKKINFTAIYISHDLALVKYVCERTIVMYLGSIVEDGPTDEVIKNPLHPYTKALVSAVPVPYVNQSHEPLPIKGNIPDATAEYSGCKFAERCPMAKEICFNNTPLLENKNENGQKAACHFCLKLFRYFYFIFFNFF